MYADIFLFFPVNRVWYFKLFFSGENQKNISNFHVLKFLLSMQSLSFIIMVMFENAFIYLPQHSGLSQIMGNNNFFVRLSLWLLIWLVPLCNSNEYLHGMYVLTVTCLTLPHSLLSNEYLQGMFSYRNKKNISIWVMSQDKHLKGVCTQWRARSAAY